MDENEKQRETKAIEKPIEKPPESPQQRSAAKPTVAQTAAQPSAARPNVATKPEPTAAAKPATAVAAKPATPESKSPFGLTLPTAATPQIDNWLKTPVLIYGKEKIGKTTFASCAPGAIFLPTEPGQNYVSVHKIPSEPGRFIESWAQFVDALNLLMRRDASGNLPHPYRTVVIDTVDGLYDLCVKYVAQKKGIESIGDMEFGKGYDLVKQELTEKIRAVVNRGFGIIFISHVTDAKESIYAGGTKREVTIRAPSIPKTGRKIVNALCDMILYFDQDVVVRDGKAVTKRVIRTKPSPNWTAGDRSGFLPPTVDMSFAAMDAAYRSGLSARAKNQPPPWQVAGGLENAAPDIEEVESESENKTAEGPRTATEDATNQEEFPIPK